MRSQLDAFSLKYTAIPEPTDQTPLALAQKHGEHIFGFDDNPYRAMPAASIARTLEYCRIFRRMEEQGDEIACILREGLTLNENFPALLQAPETLGGDWDILVLGCAGPPPRPLWFHRRPRLCKNFRMARPADFQGAIAGFLIRRQAAQNIRALALPFQKPAEQYLRLAEQRGMRLRFVQPTVVRGTKQKERIAEDAQTIWRDWEAHAYPAEYLRILNEHALQKPPRSIPNLRALLLGLYYRFPGSRRLHRSANVLLTRSGLSAKLSRRPPSPTLPAEPPAVAADDNDGAAGKVAVVIPLFNRERFIIPVIQSLEQQTRPPQRLIVVDDGSSDNSAQTVERYFADAKLPFAAELLRHEQNRGASAARNSGLRQCADCDFVHFLDSDDCPPKDFLQRAVTQLAQEPQAVAASADRLFVYGKDEAELSDVSALPDNPWLWFLFEGAALASGTLFRRSVFERTGEFDLSLPTGQDTDMFHRIAHCGKWLRLPGAPVRMLRAPKHNNLFKSYERSHGRRWMHIWENSLYRQKGVQHIRPEALPRRLHDGWLSAGVALCHAKRFVEANECFRRALACRFSLRGLLYLKMPGLPSALLQKNRLLYLTKIALLRLTPPETSSATPDASRRGAPPIFVLHPEKPDGDSLSARAQLDAFSLKYTAIPEPSAADQTPQVLSQKYGERIFRPDNNPYRTMSAASVARTPAYCRLFQRMKEQGDEVACILREEAILSEGFPDLLQSPEALNGDWDILVLGCAGPPARALRPRPKARLCADFGMARAQDFSGAIAGFLIRRRAAQNIRALALPIQKPVEQYLLDAEQYGMRLRFVQPAALCGQPPGEKPLEDRGRTMWKDWMASVYSEEYLGLLHGKTLQTQSETDPPLQVLLQRLYGRLPGSRQLQSGAKTLLTRSGLAPGRVRSLPTPQPAVPAKPSATADAGKVAVIIPLFNRERLIIPVIQSLERQSRPPQRLIVVDDGSSDNSAQTVERYFAGAKLPFTAELLRHEQNRGASAARNSGLLRTADCDFVHFLDSDDCPPQDFLQRAVAQLAQEPEAVAATVDRLSVHSGDDMRVSNLKELPDNPRLWFLFHGGAIASGTLFRRPVFERAGMFDLSLPTGEDTDIFHRIAHCGKWLHLPGAPVIMLQAPEHDALSKNYAGTRWYKWARLNRNTLPGNYTDDSWRRWAYIWENNLYRQGKTQYIEPLALRRRLCDSWLSSGVALCQAKRFEEANECFRRALACHFSVKSLLYLKMPGLPSALLTGNRLLRLTKRVLQRLTASQASSAASDNPGERVPAPPIFVLHPEKPAAGAPSARFQLRTFALAYTAVPEPAAQTPQALAQKYGEHIFRLDSNPYRVMPTASVARTPEYCRIFQRMEEQGDEIACILREGVILHENFPALLRSPAVRGGDWDILVLGCAGAPPRALPFRSRPRLGANFGMVRPVDFQGAIAGFLIRRRAAQNIRALALPIQKPVEQLLGEAEQYGMRLRFVQPAALYGSNQKEKWFGGEAQPMWRDWLASLYPAEYLDLLKSESLQMQSETAAPLRVPLQRLRRRLPGSRRLQRSARALWARSGLPLRHSRQLPAPQPPLPLEPPAAADAGADAARVAVIIPMFNRERLIIPVIQSLERQSRPPQRLIVVDDGSSDNSAQTVERYFADAKLPFAAELLRHEQNAGAAAARNSGLQRTADCDFVYFLDSDDCPPRDFLQRAAARLAQEPEAVAASADRMFLYAEGKMWLDTLRDLPQNPMRWLLQRGAAIASGTLFRRSVFERAGLFNPGLPTGEDTDMFHRIARCGKWLHLPGAPTLMLHALEHDNLSKNYMVDHWYNWMRLKRGRGRGAAHNYAEDGWRRWAYVWENNFYRRSGARHIPESLQQSRLYKAWLNSGISLYRSGRFAEANECFRRALIFGFSTEPLQYLKMPGVASVLQLQRQFLHPLRRIAQRRAPAVSEAS